MQAGGGGQARPPREIGGAPDRAVGVERKQLPLVGEGVEQLAVEHDGGGGSVEREQPVRRRGELEMRRGEALLAGIDEAIATAIGIVRPTALPLAMVRSGNS